MLRDSKRNPARLPLREEWEEYENRKRQLVRDMDAGKLEPEAYEFLVMKLAEGMGI